MRHRCSIANGLGRDDAEASGLGERPVVEDEFFRQLADGALAGAQRATATASPGLKSIARPGGQPPRRPPARRGEPPNPEPPPRQSGPPDPRARVTTARPNALGALAVAGVLVALLFGSSGSKRSVTETAEGDRPHGAPNGRFAAGDAQLRVWWPAARGRYQRDLRVGWRPGGRAVIAGRLTRAPGGAPIADGRISVLAADGSEPGQESRRVGVVRSDRHGRLVAAIALDRGAPHKLLTFAYRARSPDKRPAARARARLEVAAAVSARTLIRRTQRGRSIPLEGRGPPGATVKVLVRRPHSRQWRIHSSVKSSPTGRWQTDVCIPSHAPRGRYRLRARVLGDHRRGFLPAKSQPVSAQVR